MIRCAWCGAKNYAIDMWCARCHQHLDWRPAGRFRRRIVGTVGALASAAGVALALALPAAAWLNGSMAGSRVTLSVPAILPSAATLVPASPPLPAATNQPASLGVSNE